MARSVNEIQQTIIGQVQTNIPELTSDSKRAIWRLWTYVVAVVINLYEQLMDIFKTEVETIVSLSAPQTAQWIQDRVFKFQYSTTNPQVVQLIDLVPEYPVIDANLRIVTRCSVKSTINNVVNIKTAKNEPPEALNNTEVSALQSYVNIIGVSGIQYIVQSTAADKIYIQANIFYSGMYSAVISNTVISAIEAYLSSIPFSGTVKILDLEIAIKNVLGVNDVVFNNVKARKDSDTLANATNLVANNTVLSRVWNTDSGYIVGETTSGSTLANTLNFIAE
jgi:hypothetical protein